MNDLDSYSIGPAKRQTIKKTVIPVRFMIYAPEAHSVSVVGDFNHWYPNSHPLSRRPDGSWFGQVELPHGHHQYLFLVDSVPTLDPRAQGVTQNPKHGKVSMVGVS